jgi:hypothetical protein
MAFPISIPTIFKLVNYIIPAIKTAEQFLGRGKGKEKKEAVVNGVIAHLVEGSADAQAILGREVDLPNFGVDYKWVELLLNASQVKEKIGDIVDSIVALVNYLGSFDNDPNIPPS